MNHHVRHLALALVLHSACTMSVNAAFSQSLPDTEEETTTTTTAYPLQQHLHTTTAELTALCSTLLTPSLMGLDQKNSIQHLLWDWNQKSEQVNLDPENAQYRAGLMQQFVEHAKSMWFALQLVSLDRSQYAHAFFQHAPDEQTQQTYFFNALMDLHEWLNHAWNSKELMPFNPTDYVHSILDDYTWLKLISGSHKRLYNALGVNLFLINPLFAEEYLKFWIDYEQTKFSHDDKTVSRHLKSVELLLALLAQTSMHGSPDELAVLKFFINKLLVTKDRLLFAQKLATMVTKTPLLVGIFTKHYRFMQTTNQLELKKRLAKHKASAVVDAYVTVVSAFLKDHTPSPLLAYHAQTTLLLLETLSKKLAGSKIGLLFKSPDATAQAVQEMIETLELVKLQLPALEQTHQKETGFIQSLMSGNWLSGGSIKNVTQKGDGSVVLEFADKLLGAKKFDDIKTAAFHALMYASPFLFVKVVDLVKQYLSKEQQAEATQLSDSNGTADPAKVIEFATKNPELLQQLKHHNPEILDLVAQSLKALAPATHAP